MDITANETTLYGRKLKPCPKCGSTELKQTEDAGQTGSVWCSKCEYEPYLSAKGHKQADCWNAIEYKKTACTHPSGYIKMIKICGLCGDCQWRNDGNVTSTIGDDTEPCLVGQ